MGGTPGRRTPACIIVGALAALQLLIARDPGCTSGVLVTLDKVGVEPPTALLLQRPAPGLVAEEVNWPAGCGAMGKPSGPCSH